MALLSQQAARPTRIRRKRTKNWRAGSARCVDRSSRYRAWLHGEGPDTYRAGKRTFDRRRVHTDLWRLENRDLACTCPLPGDGESDHCHATVLLELANHPERISK